MMTGHGGGPRLQAAQAEAGPTLSTPSSWLRHERLIIPPDGRCGCGVGTSACAAARANHTLFLPISALMLRIGGPAGPQSGVGNRRKVAPLKVQRNLWRYKTSWRTAFAVVLVASALLAVGCAGTTHSAEQPRSSIPTSAARPATTFDDPRIAAVAAYRQYWKLWLEDNDPPNPDDPRLGAYEAGAALENDRRIIGQNKASGVEIQLPKNPQYAHHPVAALSADHQRITITDCALDDGLLVNATTGSVVNGQVETQLWSANLIVVDGAWKVTEARIVEKWAGVRAC